jgi:ABC-type multidrug transport system fused ATPase/permease subunit
LTRGPVRYLLWLARCQWPRVAAGGLLGSASTLSLVLAPPVIGQAIDHGLSDNHYGILAAWSAVLLALTSVGAFLGMARHRTMTKIRMDAGYRTIRVVLGHAIDLGAALPRRLTAGEVVTIGVGDVWIIARGLTVTGPGVGAVVGYAVVAVLLLRVSPLLAVTVLAGVPVVGLAIGPLLGSLHRAGARYRSRAGQLAARLLDIVGGLRLLNGLGGKEDHLGRYRAGSTGLLGEGYRVASAASWIEALATGLPALFLALVTWLGAHLAARGDITIGELAAVYGYAAILVVPVEIFISSGQQIIQAVVAARRVTALLNVEPEPVAGLTPAPGGPAKLYDPFSGVTVEPGLLTVLAGSGAAPIVDRLGRYGETGATWGGIRLDEIQRGEVRERILVADDDAHLFAGTLAEVVAGRGAVDADRVEAALNIAVANDINGRIEPDGRNLSGGQRQRVRLARALYREPEMLLAVEPTSAVDAHTEAAIAERLSKARRGRGTLIVTTSPALLDQADVVHFLRDGRVVATGTHRSLLAEVPDYRAIVARG